MLGCALFFNNMHGHEASSLKQAEKMYVLSKRLTSVNLDQTRGGTTFRKLARYHVVTKIVSIYWSNKVTLPCRY